MTPEQLVALISLLADLRLQVGQQAEMINQQQARIAELEAAQTPPADKSCSDHA